LHSPRTLRRAKLTGVEAMPILISKTLKNGEHLKYRNNNPDFGDTTSIYEAESIDAAINDLQTSIGECGEDFEDCIVTEDDIAIIE
jgi:hypothetical protein